MSLMTKDAPSVQTYMREEIDVTKVSLIIATLTYNDILEPKIRFMDI